MLKQASKYNGQTLTSYKGNLYKTICFNSKDVNENIEKNILEILNKYNIKEYKLIKFNDENIHTYTLCLNLETYYIFINKLKNNESNCQNCFPIFQSFIIFNKNIVCIYIFIFYMFKIIIKFNYKI